MDSFGWTTWTIGVLICLNIIQSHWSFLKLLERKDLHFQVGCSKTQALNPKVEQILFHKREQTSWKLLHTCLHTFLSQLRNSNRFQFSKAGQNRLQVAPKKATNNFSPFYSSPQLTNRNIGTKYLREGRWNTIYLLKWEEVFALCVAEIALWSTAGGKSFLSSLWVNQDHTSSPWQGENRTRPLHGQLGSYSFGCIKGPGLHWNSKLRTALDSEIGICPFTTTFSPVMGNVASFT